MAVIRKHTPTRQDEILSPNFVVLAKMSTRRSSTPSKPKKPALPPLTKEEHRALLDALVRSRYGTKQD